MAKIKIVWFTGVAKMKLKVVNTDNKDPPVPVAAIGAPSRSSTSSMSQVEKYLYKRVAELESTVEKIMKSKDKLLHDNTHLRQHAEQLEAENIRLREQMDQLQQKHEKLVQTICPKAAAAGINPSNGHEETILEEQTRQLRLVLDVIERHEIIEETMAQEIQTLKQQIEAEKPKSQQDQAIQVQLFSRTTTSTGATATVHKAVQVQTGRCRPGMINAVSSSGNRAVDKKGTETTTDAGGSGRGCKQLEEPEVIPELKDEFFQHFESDYLKKMLSNKPVDRFEAELSQPPPVLHRQKKLQIRTAQAAARFA